MFMDKADFTARQPKQNKVLTEDTERKRAGVDFARDRHGMPIAPQVLPSRRAGTDMRQLLVFVRNLPRQITGKCATEESAFLVHVPFPIGNPKLCAMRTTYCIFAH